MRSSIVLFVVNSVAALLASGIVMAEEWKGFLGPTQDSKSTETGIRLDWSNGKLPLVWSRALDTSYGIGSVANGRYFQFDRTEDSERLMCLDTSDGKEIWHTDQRVAYQDMYGYNNGPRSSPAISENQIFTYGVSGRLSSYERKTGKILWSRELNNEYGVIQNFFGVACSPVLFGDFVIVIVGGSPKEDGNIPLGRLDRVSGNGSGIVALNQSDGSEAYRLSVELASYSTPVIAKIGDRPIGLALMRGGLLAFDPRSGKKQWHFPWRSPRLESVNAALPVVVDDKLFVSECYDIGSVLLRFDDAAPKVLWKDPKSRREQSFRAHWATPIHHDGYLYGCSGRNEPDSDLRCIRISDGKLMWAESNRIRTSLLMIDGHFIVLDERGKMTLIKATPEHYQPVTEIDLSESLGDAEAPFLKSPCWAAPIVSDGLLFVRGANRVACFELIPN